MIKEKCDFAVLLIAFNRPENTKKVLEQILLSNPRAVYISLDGPRQNNLSDKANCSSVRSIIQLMLSSNSIKYKILDNNKNLGCKLAVYNAINWFFDHENEGIILEDDTLPNNSFFTYCEQMLIKYRDDTNIGMICGSNLIKESYTTNYSYFYSTQTPIWGWATWKRAWDKYDINMTKWNGSVKSVKKVPSLFGYREKLLNSIFLKVFNGDIDTWDYQWTFSFWENNLLSIVPTNNLIKNIGFDENATHTKHPEPDYSLELLPTNIKFPLLHPPKININKKFDLLFEKYIYKITLTTFLKTYLLKLKTNFLN